MKFFRLVSIFRRRATERFTIFDVVLNFPIRDNLSPRDTINHRTSNRVVFTRCWYLLKPKYDVRDVRYKCFVDSILFVSSFNCDFVFFPEIMNINLPRFPSSF